MGKFTHKTTKYFPYIAPRHKFRHLKFTTAISAPLHKHIRHSIRSSKVRLMLNQHKLTRKHEVSFVFTQAPYGHSVKQRVEFNAKTRRTIKLALKYVNNASRLKYVVLLEYQTDMRRVGNSCSVSFVTNNNSDV